ncbi:MAG: hypothetical protein F6K55_37830 [Moorea sp. SIO4A3]|nr:hypothetical protein [Moorena sp. SIO4A3]
MSNTLIGSAILSHPITPSPHHPITPSPHHPITPSPHHPISPSPHHPITPSPHLPINYGYSTRIDISPNPIPPSAPISRE